MACNKILLMGWSHPAIMLCLYQIVNVNIIITMMVSTHHPMLDSSIS